MEISGSRSWRRLQEQMHRIDKIAKLIKMSGARGAYLYIADITKLTLYSLDRQECVPNILTHSSCGLWIRFVEFPNTVISVGWCTFRHPGIVQSFMFTQSPWINLVTSHHGQSLSPLQSCFRSREMLPPSR